MKEMLSPRSRFVPTGHWCSVKRTDMPPLLQRSPWYGCEKEAPSFAKTEEYQQYLRRKNGGRAALSFLHHVLLFQESRNA